MILFNDNVFSVQVNFKTEGPNIAAKVHASFMVGADPQTIQVVDFIWFTTPIKCNPMAQLAIVHKNINQQINNGPELKLKLMQECLRHLSEAIDRDLKETEIGEGDA